MAARNQNYSIEKGPLSQDNGFGILNVQMIYMNPKMFIVVILMITTIIFNERLSVNARGRQVNSTVS